MFMVVPAMLTEAGMPLDQHWKVYLPVVLVSFLLMLAPMMAAERYGKVRPVLLSLGGADDGVCSCCSRACTVS